MPSLYVDHQEITGSYGDNITINCHGSISGEMKWCRLGGPCVERTTGLIDGTRVTISRNHSVFSVTMIGLMTLGSYWYVCDQGDKQMPVRLTVTERSTTSKYFIIKV